MPIENILTPSIDPAEAWELLREHIDSDNTPKEIVEQIKASLDIGDNELASIVRDYRVALSVRDMIDEHAAKPSDARRRREVCEAALKEHDRKTDEYLAEARETATRLRYAATAAAAEVQTEESQISDARRELVQLREQYPILCRGIFTKEEQTEQDRLAECGAEQDAEAWRVVRGVGQTWNTSGEMLDRRERANRRLESMSRDGGTIVKEGKYPRERYYIETETERHLLSWAVARRIESEWQHVNANQQVTSKIGAGDLDVIELGRIERGEVNE